MITLNQIRSHAPCARGYAKLLKHLNKRADDEPLSLLTVLDSNGLDDAIWCLRTEPTPERTQRFALAIARRAEHLHPQAKATLDVVERYLNGQATKAELDAVRAAARAVAYYAAYYAVNAASYAANAASNAASYAANAASDTASYAANAASDTAAEREAQAQIFREIFA